MNSISKVSDITAADLAEYIRITSPLQSEIATLNNLLGVAKTYIMQYTGLMSTELDNHQDLVIVVFILCQDMWDNRALYVDNENLNKVVETILNMHSVNLL